MHEMALTRSVVDIVVEEAKAADAVKVKTVYLTIGVARDVIEDLFESMFAYMARGTVAENASLVISRPALMVKCKKCDHTYHFDVENEDTWTCRICNERDYELYSGMEYSVDGIELVTKEEIAPEQCVG